MINFIYKRFNVIVLLWMVALFTAYIAGHTWFEWYETTAKSVFYLSAGTGLFYLSIENLFPFRDIYQKQFNVIGLLTIAVNFILFSLNFQGIITNAAILLLILYVCVGVITIGVLRNLKKYEHI